MKVAIFSDVHGNLTALEAVLADIARQGPDVILFAGDLCYSGARPSACASLLQSRPDILCLHGNTDLIITQPPPPPDDADETLRKRYAHLAQVCRWTEAELTAEQAAWLQGLPFSFRLGPTNEAASDLLVVHANPQDVHQPIFPAADVQRARWGEVRHEQPDAEIAPLLAGVTAGVIAFGHVHFPNVRHWHGLMLANISAVSLPMDGEVHARYGVLNWADGRWSITYRQVAYDLAAEKTALGQKKPPGWEDLAARLSG